MGRVLSTLIGAVCVATVVTQAIAGGVLWWHGRLTPDACGEVVAALDGSAGSSAMAEAEAEAVASGGVGAPEASPPATRMPTDERMPTYEEVLERRATAALGLADRTEQLRSAARAVAAEVDAVAADRAALAADRAAFAVQLAKAREQLNAEATEQARGLLKGMGPKKSVGYLMTLPDLSVVTLVKGLDARTASKVLAEFAAGTEQERTKGTAVFAALHSGQPEAAAFNAAAGAAASPPPGAPGG